MTVTPDSTQATPETADPGATTTERFLAFHQANPHVYTTLLRLAREWRHRGKSKCGISLLYSRVRWELSLELATADAFEMNDHYQAFYARALMHFNPELAGLFDLRRAPEADTWIGAYAAFTASAA